jgi:transcriptional regulator with XRE-family HTH domain
MKPIHVGQKVKELRKALKITQCQLAEGICTQAYISQLEKGKILPTIEILYHISTKLGVHIQYFFEDVEHNISNYMYELFDHMRNLILKQEYKEVFKIIEFEKKGPLFSYRVVKQFLLWHEGICEFHCNKDTKKALSLLDRALSLRNTTEKNLSERELEILISKGIIQCEIKEYQSAISTFKSIEYYASQHPIIYNQEIIIRLYYNYARTLYLSKDFKKSIEVCTKGIRKCENIKSMYLLGELYYQKGKAYEALEDLEEAINCYKKSEMVFILLKDDNSKKIVTKVITKLT